MISRDTELEQVEKMVSVTSDDASGFPWCDRIAGILAENIISTEDRL